MTDMTGNPDLTDILKLIEEEGNYADGQAYGFNYEIYRIPYIGTWTGYIAVDKSTKFHGMFEDELTHYLTQICVSPANGITYAGTSEFRSRQRTHDKSRIVIDDTIDSEKWFFGIEYSSSKLDRKPFLERECKNLGLDVSIFESLPLNTYKVDSEATYKTKEEMVTQCELLAKTLRILEITEIEKKEDEIIDSDDELNDMLDEISK
jgi:hypothetical protein